jgi:hypothetical protein
MHGGVRRYLENGRRPGHFLTAVICNDLKEAFARADNSNARLMGEWVKFFYNEVPNNAWGSKEKMETWLAQFDDFGNRHDAQAMASTKGESADGRA